MSFSRPMLGTLLLLAATAQGCARAVQPQEFKCPAYQGTNPLSRVMVYDGPPSEQADLMPDVSKGTADHAYASWDVGYLFDAGRNLYLVCQYSGTEKTTTIKVDKKVKQCVYQTHDASKPAEASCK